MYNLKFATATLVVLAPVIASCEFSGGVDRDKAFMDESLPAIGVKSVLCIKIDEESVSNEYVIEKMEIFAQNHGLKFLIGDLKISMTLQRNTPYYTLDYVHLRGYGHLFESYHLESASSDLDEAFKTHISELGEFNTCGGRTSVNPYRWRLK